MAELVAAEADGASNATIASKGIAATASTALLTTCIVYRFPFYTRWVVGGI
jgi:predicted benzoate:H+ symporter BenE